MTAPERMAGLRRVVVGSANPVKVAAVRAVIDRCLAGVAVAGVAVALVGVIAVAPLVRVTDGNTMARMRQAARNASCVTIE